MPKAVKKAPDGLRPYLFYGLTLEWENGDDEASGECPSCGTEDKFSINVETGEYNCYYCGFKGNATTFLRWLWDYGDKQTTDYTGLSQNRGVLPETLMQWGVVYHSCWLVPGYNEKGKLVQLYKYTKKGDRKILMATPTIGHGMFGVPLYDSNKSEVYLCEGPWDAMQWWEAGRQLKQADDGSLKRTANPKASVLADASVLGVPGATTFFEHWLSLFAGKRVHIMFDNDHPHKNPKTGVRVKGAGATGTKRVAKMLTWADKPPESIDYIVWSN